MKEIIIEQIDEGYLITETAKPKNTSWYRRHFDKLDDVLTFVRNHFS